MELANDSAAINKIFITIITLTYDVTLTYSLTYTFLMLSADPNTQMYIS